MPFQNDPDYLLRRQYRDASNLNARIAVHRRFSINPEPLWEWMWRLVKLPHQARILEIGCGPGDFWRANLHRIPMGWKITLTDFSPGMLDQARANLGPARRRFRFAQVNITHLPFPAKTFDAVFANFMLYHAPDLDQALAGIHRVLKQGGRLYAATNGPRHMQQLRELLRRLDPEAQVLGVATAFSLDSGREAIRRYFPIANCYHYDDALRVTEAEPMIAYALSASMPPRLTQEPEPLRKAIRAIIDREGAFLIEKESGLFEAIKAM